MLASSCNRFGHHPVVSRRSGGVSIGVNLNPDKVCNFDCIYCQVDRVSTSETRFVGIEQLLAELDHMLALVRSGELFEHPPRFLRYTCRAAAAQRYRL